MTASTQRQLLTDLLERQPIIRAFALGGSGILPATISHAIPDGKLIRIARGLSQRVDSELSAEQSLAEPSKLVPKGVIALTSALAFHG